MTAMPAMSGVSNSQPMTAPSGSARPDNVAHQKALARESVA